MESVWLEVLVTWKTVAMNRLPVGGDLLLVLVAGSTTWVNVMVKLRPAWVLRPSVSPTWATAPLDRLGVVDHRGRARAARRQTDERQRPCCRQKLPHMNPQNRPWPIIGERPGLVPILGLVARPTLPGMRRRGDSHSWVPDVLGVAWTVLAAVAVMAPLLRPGVSLGSFDLLSRIGLTQHAGVAVHSEFPADQVLYFAPLTNLAWHQVHVGPAAAVEPLQRARHAPRLQLAVGGLQRARCCSATWPPSTSPTP